MNTELDLQSFRILGIPISIVDMNRAVSTVMKWAKETKPRTVFVRDVASLVLAVDTPPYRKAHETADMVTPDGMPLVWIGRWRGLGLSTKRVSGADLMEEVCKESLLTGQSHFFYGGLPGVAEKLALNLQNRFPGLNIAGVFSPSLRDIGPDFYLSSDIILELDKIRESTPDFIWVGLSSPKQDYFISKAAPYVGRGVFFAVGAAFDFHAGRIRRAPLWMRNAGFEWFYRLLSEPRRLWRRYLILAPRFIWLLFLDNMKERS